MIGVMGVEDLWDLMTQTAGRKTRETKVLSPPCSTWSTWSEEQCHSQRSHSGSEQDYIQTEILSI